MRRRRILALHSRIQGAGPNPCVSGLKSMGISILPQDSLVWRAGVRRLVSWPRHKSLQDQRGLQAKRRWSHPLRQMRPRGTHAADSWGRGTSPAEEMRRFPAWIQPAPRPPAGFDSNARVERIRRSRGKRWRAERFRRGKAAAQTACFRSRQAFSSRPAISPKSSEAERIFSSMFFIVSASLNSSAISVNLAPD